MKKITILLNLGLFLLTTVSFAAKLSLKDNLLQKTQALRPEVLALALKAYTYVHEQHLTESPLLTVVDYSLPSTQKRLWVMDLKQQKLLYHLHVAHGKNSGKLRASAFSNQISSHQSSLGSLLTGNSYWGQHGYAMRLVGLEQGFNDQAAPRQLVVHGAKYVSDAFIQAHGYLGRSWGCLAVNPHQVKPLIDTIKGGSLLFAYYPQNAWLQQSAFLA